MKVCLLLTVLGARMACAQVNEYWVYKSTNLLVEENVRETKDLMLRAGKAGYTHVLLADSKFSRLGDLPEKYFEHVRQIKAAAGEAKLEIVPAVFSIGYSNDLLFHDPNLIEAMPVKGQLYKVQQGRAVIAPEVPVALPGGKFQDDKGWSWKDECVRMGGGVATVVNPAGKNARFSLKMKLQPWRQYHVAVEIRTKNFKGEPEIKVLANEHSLTWNSLKVEPTQDWKTHHAVFNSLEYAEANLYFGAWGAESGELLWRNAILEETGFVNLVRRPGAPLEVSSEGGKPLVEGKDFEPLADPLCGTKPYNGCYTVFHEPPVLKTRLPDGTKLRVSYYHGVTVHDDQACICPSEPKTLELLKDQAKRMHEAWGARGYMMSHDEIRCWNWCQACQNRQLDAGAMLAENVKQCIQLLREVNPAGRIYVWSDMFDPNHNAHGNYYLAKGDFVNSWDGLDKKVVVVPWYFEKKGEALKFFADRGHDQIMAGYYDGDAKANAAGWQNAAAPYQGVHGIMYTTWRNDYSKLEGFIAAAKGARKP